MKRNVITGLVLLLACLLTGCGGTTETTVEKPTLCVVRKAMDSVHWMSVQDGLEQAAQQKGRHAAVSLNWPQAVLLVRFPEQAPEQEVISEEANEAERYQAPDP